MNVIRRVDISELLGAGSGRLPVVAKYGGLYTMSIESIVEVGIADAAKALDVLEKQYTSAKADIVSVVQAHIDDHQKQIAAHAAEVAAAQTILSKAIPTATATATQAAAFVLTAPGYVQRVVNFLGRNWRYVALGLSGVIASYGIHAGLVHL